MTTRTRTRMRGATGIGRRGRARQAARRGCTSAYVISGSGGSTKRMPFPSSSVELSSSRRRMTSWPSGSAPLTRRCSTRGARSKPFKRTSRRGSTSSSLWCRSASTKSWWTAQRTARAIRSPPTRRWSSSRRKLSQPCRRSHHSTARARASCANGRELCESSTPRCSASLRRATAGERSTTRAVSMSNCSSLGRKSTWRRSMRSASTSRRSRSST
mmetsp:Transcript_31903/g.94867  ORF Transcript_31903/g.94867 Transcript_31903/m.94867 type:complete len:215 (+) Transcript_31903:2-646(+)